MISWKVLLLLAAPPLLLFDFHNVVVHGNQFKQDTIRGYQICSLNDPQETHGICKELIECPFAISNLRANVSPDKCRNNTKQVCCPIAKTLSQKKCEEWKTLLKTPINWSPTPLEKPQCISYSVDTWSMFPIPNSGNSVRIDEFPHVVAIGSGNSLDPQSIKWQCSGTIISSTYVITSAQCAQLNRRLVVLVQDITLEKETSVYRQILDVSERKIHPSFKTHPLINDIALLKLSRKLELSRHLIPACLPDPEIFSSSKVIFQEVSWGLVNEEGSSRRKQQKYLKAPTKMRECKQFFDAQIILNDRSNLSDIGKQLVRKNICVKMAIKEDDNNCDGEIGSSITSSPDNLTCLHYIHGIRSSSSKPCKEDTPTLFTKIQSYVEWIEKTVWATEFDKLVEYTLIPKRNETTKIIFMTN